MILYMERSLKIDGGFNIRDLGGLKLADSLRQVRPGRIVRGETPSSLTTVGVHQLVEYGIREVVDLRGSQERLEEGYGPLHSLVSLGEVTVHKVELTPVKVGVDVKRNPYENLPNTYVQLLDTGGECLAGTLQRALDVVSSPGGGAMYIHCALGKDRTGVVVAMLLDMLGVKREVIVEDYMLTSINFVPLVNKFNEKPFYYDSLVEPDWDDVVPCKAIIEETLDLLQARGGGR